MTGMAKMMMLNSTRQGRETEGRDREWVVREREPERNYGEPYNEMREYRNEMAYDMDEPESRRQRYKNGRFAPSSEYHPNKWKEGPEKKPLDERNMEMRVIGFERAAYEPNGTTMDYRGNRMHYITPEAREMDQGKSEKHGGYAAGEENMKYKKAREWVSAMKNEDGARGGHWTLEEVEKLLKKNGSKCDPVEMWAAMNALYSDLAKVNGKHGMTSADYYMELAEAFFFGDKDAVDDKLWEYYRCIVK